MTRRVTELKVWDDLAQAKKKLQGHGSRRVALRRRPDRPVSDNRQITDDMRGDGATCQCFTAIGASVKIEVERLMKPRHKFMIGFFIGGLTVCAALYAFACGVDRKETEKEFKVAVCANVTPYCIVGSEHVPCEDVPVFPLTEEDMQEPEPYTAAEIAAWRLNGVETAGGE